MPGAAACRLHYRHKNNHHDSLIRRNSPKNRIMDSRFGTLASSKRLKNMIAKVTMKMRTKINKVEEGPSTGSMEHAGMVARAGRRRAFGQTCEGERVGTFHGRRRIEW